MKWSKTKSLITLLVLAGLSLVSWTLYRYYNEQYYGQYSQYTGKAEIDNYEIIADGAGAIVHWTSMTPEEDKKMEEFGNYGFVQNTRVGSRYILRQNMKLKDTPYYLQERPIDGAYWTLSIYQVKGMKLEEETELDLYKVVEDYNVDYIPAELGDIYTWKGQEYLKIQIRDLKNYQNTKPLFLNLQNKKIEENEILAQDFNRKLGVTTSTSWDDKANGIKTVSVGGEFSIDKAFLEQTQFAKSSKPYKLLEKGNATVFILNSKNSAVQFEREATVYSLFLPSTVNVYEAVNIPPELSVDSQEHIVNSKEEFDRYYDIEKAKKLYHETE